MTEPQLVPGRSCQGCTLCCKLLEIDVLAKPRGTWCTHCDRKRGCTIYETRPAPCRGFYCGWLRLAALDERWKPAKSKLLVNFEEKANRIVIHVDPARPDAWREAPYYATIKDWALNARRQGGTVMVWVGPEAVIVLPDCDKPLGRVRDDQLIIAVERPTAAGIEIDFEVVEADDPRARGADAPRHKADGA